MHVLQAENLLLTRSKLNCVQLRIARATPVGHPTTSTSPTPPRLLAPPTRALYPLLTTLGAATYWLLHDIALTSIVC